MPDKKTDAQQTLSLVLILSLALSAVYALAHLIVPSGESSAADVLQRNYSLQTLQCILGIIAALLLGYIGRKWSIQISTLIYALYCAFLFCAICLGEVCFFYYRVPHWDTMLHLLSGAMMAALGFFIFDLVSQRTASASALPAFVVAFFSFFFAMGGEAFWEIYECFVDSILNLNMQKYATEAGTLLLGRHALADTMKDLYITAVGALFASVLGYRSLKRKQVFAIKDLNENCA